MPATLDRLDPFPGRWPPGADEQQRGTRAALDCGRKKELAFFERERGGRTAAILMSLLMTAKAAGINAGDYFRDILLRISESGLTAKDLTPHAWKEHFEPKVRARRNEILQKLTGKA